MILHTGDDDRTSRADAKVSKRAILLGGAVLYAVAVVRSRMILIEVITVWILMKALDNRLCAVFSRTNAFDASISAVAGVTMAYLCADQLGM